MEIIPVLGLISDQNLKEPACTALSLTGMKIKDKDLNVSHRMERTGMVILKSKDSKLRYEVMANRKKLMKKKTELKELHFE